MKTSKLTMWMLLALMGVVAMVSCSSDDDFDGNTSGEGIDMSDDGAVLRGEEITNEVRDLIVGTWKSDHSPAACIFSFHNFGPPVYYDSLDVKYVFTEKDKVEAFVYGKQVAKSDGWNWFEDGSYTFDEEWTVNYTEDITEHGDEIFKFYKGYFHMAIPLVDDDELPFGRTFVVNVRADGKRMIIADADILDLYGDCIGLIGFHAYLNKVADSDRVIVE